MNNRLIFITVIFVSTLWSQVTPVDPPEGTHLSARMPYRVDLSTSPQVIPNIDVTEGEPTRAGNWIVWQVPIEITAIATVSLTIIASGLPNGSKFYLRYPVPDQYVGPFYWNAVENHLEKIIGHIRSLKFFMELDIPAERHIDVQVTIRSIQSLVEESGTAVEFPVTKGMYHNTRERIPPVILVTGFWPPTNEMIRHFSPNPELNPGGWQGEDWEGRGYNVAGYFPQFVNPECSDCGQGYGDLEVDYQDTSEDFWPIAENQEPMAVITFSRGSSDHSWEVEYNYYNRTNWIGDYSTPVMPTPNPPDQGEIAYFHRYSNLPMENIVAGVAGLNIGLNPFIDWSGDPGHFISEFMGYHGVWYRDLNEYGDTPCIAAGHVHVGGVVSTQTARLAAEETIRQVMDYLDMFAYTPGDINQDDVINIQDLVVAVNVILGITELTQAQFYAADMNEDSIVNIQDIIILLNFIIYGPTD